MIGKTLIGQPFVFTTPTDLSVRTMAEWEETQALTIAWTSNPNFSPISVILREIVRHAKKEVEVIIICTNPNSIKNYLTNHNITNDNLSFIEKPYNSIWIRDYGQHSVYLNDVDS